MSLKIKYEITFKTIICNVIKKKMKSQYFLCYENNKKT